MEGWGEISQEENKEKRKLSCSVAAIFEGSPDDNGIVIGSGFLIDKQTVLTAKHVIKNKNILTLCCGFGFYPVAEEQGDLTEKEHYWVQTANPDEDSDWALLTLDEEVKGRDHLKINESGKFEETDKMFVIGNPRGVPTMISGDCTVSKGVLKDFFDIELQPEDCASGSPVFNSRTLIVEGILISGETCSHCLRANVFC